MSGIAAVALTLISGVFFLVQVDLPGKSEAAQTGPIATPESPVSLPAVTIATPLPVASVAPPGPDAAALVEKGMAALDTGDEPGAQAFFQKALAADEKNGRAHLGIGTAAMLRGDNDTAKSSFARFLELSPSDPLAEQAKALLGAL